jgi:hypothetical protein
MASVGYARVSSTGQELDVQIGKLAMCERVFKEKQSAVDADTVDEDKVEASFDNGVLKVHIPKRPEAISKQRTIPIKKAQA